MIRVRIVNFIEVFIKIYENKINYYKVFYINK